MKNFMKVSFLLLALFATTSTSFAGIIPGPNSVDCAREYRDCLNSCNQEEASLKAAKAECERAAKAKYPNGGAAYIKAIETCRAIYNKSMYSIAQCRLACKNQYLNCSEGGNQGPP